MLAFGHGRLSSVLSWWGGGRTEPASSRPRKPKAGATHTTTTPCEQGLWALVPFSLSKSSRGARIWNEVFSVPLWLPCYHLCHARLPGKQTWCRSGGEWG